LTDDFKFQMEERTYEVLDNPEAWGRVAEFVVDHPYDVGCGRPNYIRVTMGYSQRVIQVVGEEGWLGAVATFFYKYFPILIGAKAVLCATCHNVGFISPLHERLWRIAQFFSNAEVSKMIVLQSDVDRVPYEKRDAFFSDS
jgi:hypothetical protein